MLRDTLIFALTFMTIFSFGMTVYGRNYHDSDARLSLLNQKIDYLLNETHARQNENIRIMVRINNVENRRGGR